jgi:hypothetical protein
MEHLRKRMLIDILNTRLAGDSNFLDMNVRGEMGAIDLTLNDSDMDETDAEVVKLFLCSCCALRANENKGQKVGCGSYGRLE